MAQLEEAVYAILSEDGVIGSTVSTRIYPVLAPPGTRAPYVTYQRISSVRLHHLHGALGECTSRIQIDFYAKTYSQARDLGDRVRRALDGYQGTAAEVEIGSVRLDSDRDFYEDGVEPALWRVSADYFFQYLETLPDAGVFASEFSAEFS